MVQKDMLMLNGVLVSLASQHSTVPYDMLMSALGFENERQLEDFIIQAIYQDVVQGRLNPAKRVFEVTDWNSRQFGEPDLQFMTETLVHWGKHCNQFVNMLAAQANDSNKKVATFAANERRVVEEAENIRKMMNFDEYGNARKFWATPADKGEFGSAFGANGPSGSKGGSNSQKPETKRFKSGPQKKRGGGTGGSN